LLLSGSLKEVERRLYGPVFKLTILLLLLPFCSFSSSHRSRPPSSLHITTIISTSALSVGDALRVLDSQKVDFLLVHPMLVEETKLNETSLAPFPPSGHQIRLYPPLRGRRIQSQPRGSCRGSSGAKEDLQKCDHDSCGQGERVGNQIEVSSSFLLSFSLAFLSRHLLARRALECHNGCRSFLYRSRRALTSPIFLLVVRPDPSPPPLSSLCLHPPRTSFSTTNQ